MKATNRHIKLPRPFKVKGKKAARIQFGFFSSFRPNSESKSVPFRFMSAIPRKKRRDSEIRWASESKTHTPALATKWQRILLLKVSGSIDMNYDEGCRRIVSIYDSVLFFTAIRSPETASLLLTLLGRNLAFPFKRH